MSNFSPFISVIIPTYNVELYLDEAICSILKQTYQNFEIIIINDGSTDSSLSIAYSYANSDKRIKIITQSNLGPSKARNVGIINSQGKFIYFFDSDDLIEPHTLEICINLITKLDLDLVTFSGIAFSTIPNAIEPFRFYQKPDILAPICGAKLLTRLIESDAYSSSPCLYLFDRKIIDKGNFYFDEGYLHEDEGFAPLLYCSAERAISISNCLFKRRVRENSIITSGKTFKNIEGLVQSAFKIQEYSKKMNSIKNKNYKILKAQQRILLRRAIKESDNLNCSKSFISLIRNKFKNLELFKIDPAVFFYVRSHTLYVCLRFIKRSFLL